MPNGDVLLLLHSDWLFCRLPDRPRPSGSPGLLDGDMVLETHTNASELEHPGMQATPLLARAGSWRWPLYGRVHLDASTLNIADQQIDALAH